MSWIGSQANIFEKQKVREIASLIRDTDRHGKARIVDANEGEEPEEMLKVRVLLFCNSDSGNEMKWSEDSWISESLSRQVLGPVPQLAESTPEEDSKADASNSASLYKVNPAH